MLGAPVQPTLLDSLFALLLSTPGRGLEPGPRSILAASSPETWQETLEQLAPHKVFPLLVHQLRQSGLLSLVPEAERKQLEALHAEVRARNALLFLTLARVLRLLEQRGETALLLKGILLADSYYPDFSTRPMSDLDLVAVPGREEVLFSLLAEAGFRPSLHHTVQAHSITYMNREGVFCDAHRTLPLFEGEPWESLVRETVLTRVHGVRALALEPHAMIAHLAGHMTGHASDLGFVLLWILDLAFVLRRDGAQIAPGRVRRLLADDVAWALLLRMVRLLERAGEPLPAAWKHLGRAVPPLSLAATLRQRRIIPWGLPGPLGWARLVAHGLGVHRSERPLPRSADLVLWPLDALSARVAPSIARRVGR